MQTKMEILFDLQSYEGNWEVEKTIKTFHPTKLVSFFYNFMNCMFYFLIVSDFGFKFINFLPHPEYINQWKIECSKNGKMISILTENGIIIKTDVDNFFKNIIMNCILFSHQSSK